MRVISTTILETNKNVLVPLQTGESELIPRAKENNPTYFDLQRVIEKHKREHPKMVSNFVGSFLTPHAPDVRLLLSNIQFFEVTLKVI